MLLTETHVASLDDSECAPNSLAINFRAHKKVRCALRGAFQLVGVFGWILNYKSIDLLSIDYCSCVAYETCCRVASAWWRISKRFWLKCANRLWFIDTATGYDILASNSSMVSSKAIELFDNGYVRRPVALLKCLICFNYTHLRFEIKWSNYTHFIYKIIFIFTCWNIESVLL